MLHVDMSMSEAKRCEACCGTDGVLLLTRCTAPNSVFRGHWRVDLSGEHSVSDDCHGRAARSVCRCCWRIGLRRPATVGRLGNHQSRESDECECWSQLPGGENQASAACRLKPEVPVGLPVGRALYWRALNDMGQ